MTYKPDWADDLASATTHLRGRNGWEYDRPCNNWESMPWFIRWPLAAGLGAYLGGAFALCLISILFR